MVDLTLTHQTSYELHQLKKKLHQFIQCLLHQQQKIGVAKATKTHYTKAKNGKKIGVVDLVHYTKAKK